MNFIMPKEFCPCGQKMTDHPSPPGELPGVKAKQTGETKMTTEEIASCAPRSMNLME
jgi:hypothetical protein